MSLSRYPRVPGKHHDPKQLGYWKLGRILGEGTSGRVRIARHAKTGQMAAIKIIPKNLLTSRAEGLNLAGADAERQEQSLRREVVLMKLIEHPNIMGLYDVWDLPDELFLVLEYVQGGELLEHLSKVLESGEKSLPIPQALSFFQQIVIAVSYCHRLNVYHRDLKLENILVDNDFNVKIADFGLASFQPNSIVRTACGSPHYCAPEVITGYGNYNGAMADVWSCGIILYTLLTCSLPFNAELDDDLKDEILQADVHFPDGIHPDAQDLISRMLTKEPHKRITMSEVQNHPFFLLDKPKIVYRGISSLEQIAMPLKSVDDIDPELLHSLRTLWREASDDDEIRASLTNLDLNWQKGAYHLLFEYRRKRLQAYDEQIAEFAEKHMQKKTRAAKESAGSIPKRTGDRWAPTYSDLPPSRSSIPSRDGPPTPRRAARGGRTLGGATSNMSSDASFIPMQKPSHLIPSRFSEDEIQLDTYDATPYSSSNTLRPPPSGSGRAPSALAPIAVPESDDPKVQAFYNQVLEHLSVLHSRTTTTSTTITTASREDDSDNVAEGIISPNLALMQEIFKDRTMMGVSTATPPVLARINKDNNTSPEDVVHFASGRFHTRPLSLKRKEAETASTTPPTGSPATKQHRPKRPTITTANLNTGPNPADKENARSDAVTRTDNNCSSNSAGIVKKKKLSLRKAFLSLGGTTATSPPTGRCGNRKRVQILHPVLQGAPTRTQNQRPSSSSKLKKKRSLQGNVNVNNTLLPSSKPKPSSDSTSSDNSSSPTSFLSPFSAPASASPTSSSTIPHESFLLSPMSTGSSNYSSGSSSGWFASVFKFAKPEVFTLFSMHGVHTTRNECRRLLMDLDVRVILEEEQEEGPDRIGGILKCKIDEIKLDRGTNGGVTSGLKATKFKIIVRRSREGQVQRDTTNGVYLIFVHEKGSTESFREICRRIKREWSLNDAASQTPEQLVPSPIPPLATRRAELLSPV
ncbi:hypothetical protein D9757_004751 [Collybiopsis confluens]|uniref:Protein kinase domain-containing protein n=1 Tax=Collybiopsis confluens TaxID=2823264 RepID=A0A8H5HS66_9AGAR|nr:hypothetical protein D9757_004751 [Collybiopsis confluens]